MGKVLKPKFVIWILFTCLLFLKDAECKKAQKNVLMIVADDLRPQLGCYEGEDFPTPISPAMITPNIDALAKKSALFTRAHVQYALCSPSRASFMTGRRPLTTKVYNLEDYWRIVGGNFSTIPQYFRKNGYRTYGNGKIFHSGSSSGGNDPISWTEPYYVSPSYANYWKYVINNNSWLGVNSTFEATVSPLRDTEEANFAVSRIQNMTSDPFFMAVGFRLPHLPWIVPESYLDLYPLDDVGLPPNAFTPHNLPDVSWMTSGEIRNYHDIKALEDIWTGRMNTTLPDSVVRDLRRGYYAAVSYMDYNVGRVLRALEDKGLAENTVILLCSDHGYQIGEHTMWGKHSNFETSTHAPLMIHIPGVTEQGIKLRNLVEYVDIFPTLVTAAGLPSVDLCPENSTNIEVCVEGSDLMPLISNPETTPWKDRVFMNYRRGSNKPKMGYSMRTDQFRFTEWFSFNLTTNKPDYGSPEGVELYDRENDPQENTNVADLPEFADEIVRLRDLLRQGWRAALPVENKKEVLNVLNSNEFKTLREY